MSHNHFSDLTDDEREAYKGSLLSQMDETTDQSQQLFQFGRRRLQESFDDYWNGASTTYDTSSLPSSKDWVTQGGVVTAVQNQGQCESCWTFSTAGTIESARAIATGTLQVLS